MYRRMAVLFFVCAVAIPVFAQDLSSIQIHGFVTQGLLYSTNNNYLSMNSTSGSLQWTDGAVSFSDSLTDKLRVGIQLHMYQLGQFGGSNIAVDWALGDYKVNNWFGVRAGKVKTAYGLFNDTQDVDAVHLWALLPEPFYPPDNKSFYLSNIGGQVYGGITLGERAGKILYRGFAGYRYIDTNSGYNQTFQDLLGAGFTTPLTSKVSGGDLRWQTPLKGLTVGSSILAQTAYGALTGGFFNSPVVLSPDFYAKLERGKLFVGGEYKRFNPNVTLTLGGHVLPTLFVDQRMWYLMTSYRILPKLQAGVYYTQELSRGPNTGLPANFYKDWVISGRYDFNTYFYAKLEGHFINGNGFGDYVSTNPQGYKPKSNMLAAKVGFSF
jgi:hypothetical protein